MQVTYNQIGEYAADLQDAQSEEAALLHQISQQETEINALLKQAKDEEAAARKAAQEEAARKAAREEAQKAAQEEAAQEQEAEEEESVQESQEPETSQEAEEPASEEPRRIRNRNTNQRRANLPRNLRNQRKRRRVLLLIPVHI